MLQININNTILKVDKGDLTALDIEAIVFYAQPDLKLGAGFGNAISVRGGPSIQEELKTLGSISVGEAVITRAGELKSEFIIHAVGPRFQEPDTEEKLHNTMQRVLNLAEEKGIKKIAFPPMGTGFYGIPLDVSANVMLSAIRNHLSGNSNLSEVLICVMDKREYTAFEKNWEVKEKV
ncbi:MAG: macro domain-containing protein [Ignavibacteriaceae bacterium]